MMQMVLLTCNSSGLCYKLLFVQPQLTQSSLKSMYFTILLFSEIKFWFAFVSETLKLFNLFHELC